MLDRIKKIVIGPYTYGMVWFHRKAKNRGWISFEHKKIWVGAGLESGEKVEVFNHELLHGVEDAQSLDLPEDTIQRLALGQAAVWKANPEILKAMYEELTGGGNGKS